MKQKILKFSMVCMICLMLITGIVLLVQALT